MSRQSVGDPASALSSRASENAQRATSISQPQDLRQLIASADRPRR